MGFWGLVGGFGGRDEGGYGSGLRGVDASGVFRAKLRVGCLWGGNRAIHAGIVCGIAGGAAGRSPPCIFYIFYRGGNRAIHAGIVCGVAGGAAG